MKRKDYYRISLGRQVIMYINKKFADRAYIASGFMFLIYLAYRCHLYWG